MFFNRNKKYISCDLIEHGIDFFSNSINFCCRIPPNFNGYKAIVPDYHGEILNWKKFFEIKRKYRDMAKKGILQPECEGCFYLQEKEWDRDDYISFINFNNWNVCNEHCIYCNLNDTVQPKQYNVYPAVKDLAEKGFLRKGGHITIAGGEPSVAPEFDDLIELFLNLDMDTIRVLTNATRYSNVVERGISEGKVNIVVSVDSGTRETFIKVKKFDFYDKVWENLEKYAKVQPNNDRVKSKFILIPGVNDNKNEIDCWLKKSIESQIKYVAFDLELNWFAQNQHDLPKELFCNVEYVLNKVKEYGLEIEFIDRGALVRDIIKSSA